MTLKESMEIIDSVETDEKTKEAITLAKAAMEKQIAKKPKHIHEEYEKHLWKTDARGNVDEWAFESGFCKGVLCLRCGETECVHCNPLWKNVFFRVLKCQKNVRRQLIGGRQSD